KADHHPNISIHSWNKVELAISTHDEGGITEKDISLLNAIDP
ncbi:MAG: 4a-hydroxytetrahydrobiopterin dehydratase, partial [Melioribacteraceae bacterium]|nr:4a-hydroxytetrahydrobiopterin dehydratase [Melioribacteraceae bacterium]